MTSRSTHLRGILLAGGGMLLISPDGLLFRLMSASDLQILFWRGLAGFLTLAIYIQMTDAEGFIGAVRRCRWAGLLCTVLMAAGTIFFISSITRTAVANTLVIRANRHVSLLPALGLSGLVIAMVVFPFIEPMAVTARDFGIMVFMGMAFQSLAFGLFLAAGRHLPPAEVGLFALVETVLGPFWAWVGVGEVPTINALIGGGIVVLTLTLHSILGLRRSSLAPADRPAD